MPHHHSKAINHKIKFSIITQKFPGGPFKFQEISRISGRVFKFQEISRISRISRSCRHPAIILPASPPCLLDFSEDVHCLQCRSWPHLLSQRWLAPEVQAPLNPVLVACYRFKRTHADPLCLPEIVISEYVLSWSACTDELPKPGLEPRPPEPDGHTGQAHCSEWLTPLLHWGRLQPTVKLLRKRTDAFNQILLKCMFHFIYTIHYLYICIKIC